MWIQSEPGTDGLLERLTSPSSNSLRCFPFVVDDDIVDVLVEVGSGRDAEQIRDQLAAQVDQIPGLRLVRSFIL
jgi:hypothetical protein